MPSTKVAAIQLAVEESDAAQLAKTAHFIREAAQAGASLVVLPERFAQWHQSAETTQAESVPGRLSDWLAAQAREHHVYLAGGSVLERDPGHALPFNTSLLFAPDGALLGRYHKIHLFDALVNGVIHGESSFVSAGSEPVCLHTDLGVLGLSICYDLRFPELYRRLVDMGAQILLLPAGFTRVTGAAHWEPLVRARAIENQCFVIAAGMVGQTSPTPDFFGHSMIVDPWGTVLAHRDDDEGVVLADLDLGSLDSIRERLPALLNRQLR